MSRSRRRFRSAGTRRSLPRGRVGTFRRVSAPALDVAELRAQVAGRQWYHTLELAPGVVTPGWFDTRAAVAKLPLPDSLEGMRCLDVGTFDGFWAFEMERRGAREVVAVDLADPAALDWPYDTAISGPQKIAEWGSERERGFADLAATLGSQAKWINQSVYDLSPERNGMYDVVFCGALLLHLRDPIRALEAMRSVCSGSFVLTENIEERLELLARFVPSALVVSAIDQWFRPNSAGLRAMADKA